MSEQLAPALGTFLYPAGRCFALEVTHAWTDGRRLPRVRCRRWGWRDDRVFNDGYRSDDHMLALRYRGPGCWTSALPWSAPTLWRAVPGPTGQTELFA